MSSPCGSRGRRQVSLMKRVETSEATTSRGAEGTGPGPGPGPGPEPGLEPELPPEPSVTRSAGARISVGEGEGAATSLIGGKLWMSEVRMKCEVMKINGARRKGNRYQKKGWNTRHDKHTELRSVSAKETSRDPERPRDLSISITTTWYKAGMASHYGFDILHTDMWNISYPDHWNKLWLDLGHTWLLFSTDRVKLEKKGIAYCRSEL